MQAVVKLYELQAALARVLPFVSTDSMRPVMQSVHFSAQECGALTLVAADGFRLAKVTIPAEVDGDFSGNIGADYLGMIMPKKTPKYTWGMNSVIDSKWLDQDKYPDYESLFMKEFDVDCALPVEAMLKAVEAMNKIRTAYRGYESKAIHWSISPQGHVFEISIGEHETISYEITTEEPPVDEPLIMAVNIEYLLSALQSIMPETRLRTKRTNAAMLQFDLSNLNRWVLMPMHTSKVRGVRIPGGNNER